MDAATGRLPGCRAWRAPAWSGGLFLGRASLPTETCARALSFLALPALFFSHRCLAAAALRSRTGTDRSPPITARPTISPAWGGAGGAPGRSLAGWRGLHAGLFRQRVEHTEHDFLTRPGLPPRPPRHPPPTPAPASTSSPSNERGGPGSPSSPTQSAPAASPGATWRPAGVRWGGRWEKKKKPRGFAHPKASRPPSKQAKSSTKQINAHGRVRTCALADCSLNAAS